MGSVNNISNSGGISRRCTWQPGALFSFSFKCLLYPILLIKCVSSIYHQSYYYNWLAFALNKTLQYLALEQATGTHIFGVWILWINVIELTAFISRNYEWLNNLLPKTHHKNCSILRATGCDCSVRCVISRWPAFASYKWTDTTRLRFW